MYRNYILVLDFDRNDHIVWANYTDEDDMTEEAPQFTNYDRKRGRKAIAASAFGAALVVLQACGGGGGGGSSGGSASSSTSSSSLSSSSTTSSSSSSASSSSTVAGVACSGTYLLCDDFNGPSIDTSKWTVGNTSVGKNHPVRPENVSLATIDDNGTPVTVVDTAIYGDLHAGPHRQGGLLISSSPYGGGRYELRMKPLPGPHGCSCFWNYYDSDNEASPPATRVYTEIDIEMPGHIPALSDWNRGKFTQDYNTWSHTDTDADATYIQNVSTINPYDGQFHVFRWDWHDGTNGSLQIDWFIDGVLQTSTTQHVSGHPAQIWVGNWPAPWTGMDYNFDTMHLYIDWVRISSLP